LPRERRPRATRSNETFGGSSAIFSISQFIFCNSVFSVFTRKL